MAFPKNSIIVIEFHRFSEVFLDLPPLVLLGEICRLQPPWNGMVPHSWGACKGRFKTRPVRKSLKVKKVRKQTSPARYITLDIHLDIGPDDTLEMFDGSAVALPLSTGTLVGVG